jgi:urease accessory protein
LGGAAEAHTFGAQGAGFGQGLVHPFGGLDHVLAMMGVGLWASRMKSGARWHSPAAFLAMMIAGGAAGMAGLALPLLEMGIALSVLLIGAAIALSWDNRPAAGAELPQAALPALYGGGFVLATSVLLGLGLGLGGLMRRAGEYGVRSMRLAGGLTAGAALILMAGL